MALVHGTAVMVATAGEAQNSIAAPLSQFGPQAGKSAIRGGVYTGLEN